MTAHVITLINIDPKMLELANANKRLHWARKAKVTEHWRTAAWSAVLFDRTERPLGRSHVTVIIRWPDRRKRDPGNWAPLGKALVDGLVDAGVWPDDDSKHVVGPDMRRDPENGPHRVTIRIEAAS